MTNTDELLVEVKRVLEAASVREPSLGAVTDSALIESMELVEEISRQLDVFKARRAGEAARRSAPEFGSNGLAARHGHLNPQALVRAITRSSFAEAARRVRVGAALLRAEVTVDFAQRGADGLDSGVSSQPVQPFDSVAGAVSQGRLGIDAADRVIRALEPIASIIEPALFQHATSTLVNEGVSQNADQLAVMARRARDTLDAQGIDDRQAYLRSRRSLRRSAVVDGLRHVKLVLDPESDSILFGAVDHVMSPRLGGPRFVDPADEARSELLRADPRTNEQIALDTLIDLVRVGVDSDDGTILGASKPAVRVTISLADLMVSEGHDRRMNGDRTIGQRPSVGSPALVESRGPGSAETVWLEGSSEPLSVGDARRLLCDRGALPIVLGGASEPLDVGRTRRLFTGPQRVALAFRDAGCRWPDCDRPPSWSEAHHINPFGRGGATDLADGVLLCRRHHLILHNNGWRIDRDGAEYWLTPPATLDPLRARRPMHSKRADTPGPNPQPADVKRRDDADAFAVARGAGRVTTPTRSL